MSRTHSKRTTAIVIAATSLVLLANTASAAPAGTSKGASTTTDPYVIPINPSAVQIKSLLTVGSTSSAVGGVTPADPGTTTNGYAMVGIPDGLGAYDDGNNVTLMMNHELGATSGVARSTGLAGAFTAKYTINPVTGEMVAGQDLIPNAAALDMSGTTGAFGRFCSGDLAEAKALYNATSGNGYNGRLYFTGEESGVEGRLVGHDPITGAAKVLLATGRMSWENFLLADTSASDTTVGVGMYDNAGGRNFVYYGTKTNTGTIWDKAGLTSGSLYAPAIVGATTDAGFRTAFGKSNPRPFTLVPVTGVTGAAQQASAAAGGAIALDRSEDGAWDPSNPNDFYFVTTGSTAINASPVTTTNSGGRGGLWRMSFNDRTNPAAGGTLTLLIDSNEVGARVFMPDNMTVDNAGHILIQEDPGGTAYIARIWAYDIPTARLAPIATFDPQLFGAGTATITTDEESSGIVPAPASFGANTFLLDAQVHTSAGLINAAASVERGQLMTMTIDFDQAFNPSVVVPQIPAPVVLTIGGLVVGGMALALQRRRSHLI
jgi:Bacterial protein of unknown function (DUF839)